MSFLIVRGGIPHVFRDTIDTTGRDHRPPAPSQNIAFRAGANDLRVFFSEADFDNDVGYITIPAGEERLYPIETARLWLKAAAATTAVDIYVFQRLV